ncbi:DcaP family trimeric outer membrane transporter [uncultured Marinobacter sp.]|uniref:DcaP family trimeric outer membrane transporter n=1 Tax=uncultured Marinobacter sp. TaxID=187379 RepID=UPI0023560ECE|tara:strand:- start:1350 stop:1895 length:546 start_codon:yes stop_codon:yes gene_type:complete
MQSNNKLRLAIRAAAIAGALGMAGQAGALTLDVGDDVEASLYGYARLNMSYDIDDNRAVSTRAGSFSPADEDVKGHFGADVQQSRIGVKVKHSSGVTINVEGDFRGSGNGAGSLRMRHAYGTYMGVLAGRTWSNYTSFVGNTPTLDFDSLAGTAGSQDRTEQIRYTTGALSFSLEDPSLRP